MEGNELPESPIDENTVHSYRQNKPVKEYTFMYPCQTMMCGITLLCAVSIRQATSPTFAESSF